MRGTFEGGYKPKYSPEEVFNRLEDDESREIFNWRFAFVAGGNWSDTYDELFAGGENSLNRYGIARDREGFKERCARYRECFFSYPGLERCRGRGIVVVGESALQEYLIMKAVGFDLRAFCADKCAGRELRGIACVSSDDAVRGNKGCVFLIDPNEEWETRKIIKRLKWGGATAEDVAFLPRDRSLNTELSEIIFDRDQYFLDDIIKPKQDEVFIDAGMLDGETSAAFCDYVAKRGGSVKYIYGFEPDKRNAEATYANLIARRFDNITVIPKGVWDKDDTLTFTAIDGNRGASRISEDGGVTIETTTIDASVDPAHKVTYIKMDIEGAELNALFGARETIKRDKPRLAICVYHKIRDILLIPSYILELNPNYRLYLRHHFPVGAAETVLYAVDEEGLLS